MSKTVKPSWSFPAVSATSADTAHTTMGSLFSFNGYKLGYVWNWTSLIVVLGRQQTFGFMPKHTTMGSLFLFNGNKLVYV